MGGGIVKIPPVKNDLLLEQRRQLFELGEPELVPVGDNRQGVGSFSGCPGSTATLKHGIEARLREEIPEVEGVVAL